jgi:hypothetical protein
MLRNPSPRWCGGALAEGRGGGLARDGVAGVKISREELACTGGREGDDPFIFNFN